MTTGDYIKAGAIIATIAVCLFSCTPSGIQPPHQADLYPNGDTTDGPGIQPPRLPWQSPIPTIIMHFGMRGPLDYGARDGIFHGRVVGETEPFLFGFVDRMSHVLIMQQMHGVDVPTLPVTIEIYKSRGRP